MAARLADQTSHGGLVTGPGIPTVLIENKPAAVMHDLHTCPVPQPHPPSPFELGSTTVLIGGRGALRVGDSAGCGAAIVLGAVTVDIGG
jgi:uncharacterized Zn-binding protein involved in type VI secretion